MLILVFACFSVANEPSLKNRLTPLFCKANNICMYFVGSRAKACEYRKIQTIENVVEVNNTDVIKNRAHIECRFLLTFLRLTSRGRVYGP